MAAQITPLKARRTASHILADLRGYRLTKKLNQRDFWSQYGATQSGGSRYEDGRKVPSAVVALMVLHDQGIINEETLRNLFHDATPLD